VSKHYKGFTELTFKELVDTWCEVKAGDEHRTFTSFVVVGFGGEGEDEECCITAASLTELYFAIVTLQQVFKRAIKDAPPELRREVEAEIALENSMLGEDGWDDIQ